MEKGRDGRAEEDHARPEEQGRLPVVDDERANAPYRYVGVGLLSLLLLAAGLGALVLPPAFAAGFILRGRPALRLIGYGLLATWLVGVLWVGRRLMSARARPE